VRVPVGAETTGELAAGERAAGGLETYGDVRCVQVLAALEATSSANILARRWFGPVAGHPRLATHQFNQYCSVNGEARIPRRL
jgi:hypothetical protein